MSWRRYTHRVELGLSCLMGLKHQHQRFGTRWIVQCMLIFSTLCALPNHSLATERVFVGPYDNETIEQRDQRMSWWREARFGLFIHWGVYAVPAGTHEGRAIENIGEWIMHYGKIPVVEYKKYAADFNPTQYDPEAWVLMAKDAGMKYIVITAKHHDGFALFDTDVSDWNIVKATPYGKDVLKPLAEAARKHGIKLGFYYSQAQDWVHPGGSTWEGRWDQAQKGDMDRYLQQIAVPQIKELFTNYGEISVIWWDTPIDMTPERARLFDGVVDLQPGVITNNRLIYGFNGGYGFRGDFRTPEQHIPATGLDYDWEACQTMNTTWGYKSYDNEWKSSETLIRNLVDIASKGGNYLLNVGPMANGEIPPESLTRLKDVGSWMKVNSSSIYGTTASPFVRLPWGRATKKQYPNATELFLHIFDWPTDGQLAVDGLHSEVIGAYFLADYQYQISVTKSAKGWVLNLPDEPLDNVNTVVVLKIKGALDVERLLPTQTSDGMLSLKLTDVAIHNPSYGGELVLGRDSYDNRILTEWTDSRSHVDWLFDVKMPGQFDVYADVSVKSTTSFVLTVAGESSSVTIEPTGHEGFERRLISRVVLPLGETGLSLQPSDQLWSPIQLRSIKLEPVQ